MRAENLVGNCELSAWNETTKTCVGKAKSQSEIDTCIEGTVGAPKRINTDAAMRAMTAFKDQMCACRDTACAQHVSDEMTTWGQQQAKDNAEPPRMTEEETKAFTQIGEEMGKCMQRAMEPADAAPAQPLPK